MFQDMDKHVGILRFDAVFQDIVDVFSTTPKAKKEDAEQGKEEEIPAGRISVQNGKSPS